MTERLGRFPLAILQLIFRFSVASVFFNAGHSKILELGYDDPALRQMISVPVLTPEVAAAWRRAASSAAPR